MNRTALKMSHALMLVIVGMLVVGPAAADKPSKPVRARVKKASRHNRKSKNKSKGEQGGHG